MKNKGKKRIHTDKKGREYIKESYFVGGKMKHHRVYVIDGMPAQEFYEQNATDLDFFKNGDYEFMQHEKDNEVPSNQQNTEAPDSSDFDDIPF